MPSGVYKHKSHQGLRTRFKSGTDQLFW
ncbi:hypothetical protein LCGC14_1413640, partial [marine sediment metagenome]